MGGEGVAGGPDSSASVQKRRGSEGGIAAAKTAKVKAQKRESRHSQMRQMRRSSSSVVVDAGLAAKFKSMSAGVDKAECLTPTRVSFNPNLSDAHTPHVSPSLSHSVSEGGAKVTMPHGRPSKVDSSSGVGGSSA